MYKIKVNLAQKDYPILIKRGIINSLDFEIGRIYKNKKIAIITDHNIKGIYGDRIIESLSAYGFQIHTISVNPGEGSKSIQVLSHVYNQLLDIGINRKDLIVAFGGGVVGDLAGFAASTFLRGIRYIQVPTSLLAQIDSSVGGKVGINLPRGKNLVGNFYHPESVFIDPDLLNTLPNRYLYDGMAEVIKYACIRDKTMYEKLLSIESKEKLYENIEEIIYSCCSIKKEIVEKDERESGERMLLNFGHTIGHAIEKVFNYETFTHGEAVAIGMYCITRQSEEMGITKKGTSSLIKRILVQYNLPFEIGEIDNSRLLESIALDKKGEEDILNIVLLKEIGAGFINKINKEDIGEFVSHL
ncbi:MAG: 3-dehydroquinate synthase [Gottschalkiaceae bacterium]|nr:MAG: 3-dehydroquinate synthase [Gottschalkiaceae bacterium]